MTKYNNIYNLLKIIVVILLILVSYWVLFLKPNGAKISVVNTKQVLESKVFSPVLSLDGNDIYYFDIEKLNFYKHTLSSGQSTQLSNFDKLIPENIFWSEDRSKVFFVTLFDSSSVTQTRAIKPNQNLLNGDAVLFSYDVASSKLTSLKENIILPGADPSIINPIWCSNSVDIIYYYYDTNSSNVKLAKSSFDGNNEHIIGVVPTDISSIIAYSENDNIIYYATETNNETEVFQVKKYDLNTNQGETISTAKNFIKIDQKQFIYTDIGNSILYNMSNGAINNLPLSIKSGQATSGQNTTSLLVDVFDNNRELFFVIDLKKLKVTAKLDPEGANTGYTDFSLSPQNLLYYVNNQTLFVAELKI